MGNKDLNCVVPVPSLSVAGRLETRQGCHEVTWIIRGEDLKPKLPGGGEVSQPRSPTLGHMLKVGFFWGGDEKEQQQPEASACSPSPRLRPRLEDQAGAAPSGCPARVSWAQTHHSTPSTQWGQRQL